MNSIGPSPIYMIYTHTTHPELPTKHLEQTAIAAPPDWRKKNENTTKLEILKMNFN